jgi:hypothetical protein
MHPTALLRQPKSRPSQLVALSDFLTGFVLPEALGDLDQERPLLEPLRSQRSPVNRLQYLQSRCLNLRYQFQARQVPDGNSQL